MMNKAGVLLKLIILFIFLSTPFFTSGCASNAGERGVHWEPWVGKLSGTADVEFKMFLSRFEEEQGAYQVKGNFEGEIGGAAGGADSGTVQLEIKGKVKDGIFNARIWGQAITIEGANNVRGNMIGTLAKTQAFGTWVLNASDDEDSYQYTGEWRAKKMDGN
jgi:hypothetical protein